MKARVGRLHRTTTETDIRARLNLDGHGRYRISTGVRFLDHMLELFTRHGGFDLELQARGDLDVDQHHTVEDAGIVRRINSSSPDIVWVGLFTVFYVAVSR